MDGNIYNYGPANMWNGCNEGFQPPPLDLQNYMPANREHFSREQSKNSLVPPAPPYVFFNYPEQSSHHHHHHIPENINRNQWHFPTWPKMKVRSDSMFQEAPKRYTDKQFHKDCSMAMPIPHPGPPNLNIPAPGVYYPPQTSEQMTADIHRIGTVLDPQGSVNINIPATSNTNNHSTPDPSCVCRSTSRKNPAPRRRKDTPKKEDKSLKKRTRDEEKWARNIRKKARSKGESYVSVQGKTVPARSVKAVDCSKCKFNCPSRVPQEEREKLFREYWELHSFKEKVDYIAGCIHEFAPLRPVSGRRAYSRRYMLKINGKDERVCKEFFVTTFDISESTIVTYMGKKRKGPEAVADLRGKQTPSNKTPESTVRLIREHILSQIGLQGELNRTPSEDVKNVKRLYQHYQMECELEDTKPASISVYRKVYSDMHKDTNDTPVEIPPDNILAQNKKTKKLKHLEKEDGLVPSSLEEEEEEEGVASFESSLSPEPNTSSSSMLSIAEITAAGCTTLPETTSPHELGLRQYSYHGSSQCFPSSNPADPKMCSLNIPHTLQQQQQLHHTHCRQQQQTVFRMPYQGDPMTSNHERGHVNNMLPFTWDSNRMGSSAGVTSDHTLGYCPASYSNQNHLIQPPSSALSSSLFNYRISSSSLPTSSAAAPLPVASIPSTDSKSKHYQLQSGEVPVVKRAKEDTSSCKIRKSKENKSKKEPKKRIRNEDSWGRNIRKRLRFKGEAYTSVRGKLVEAKRVKEVDCSDCKFKCTTRINKEQQGKLNELYWSLDTYKKKIEFLTKYVETYTPKRKMTGRRAFSRKYTFNVDGTDERVCKDFFKATLHVSESTIATALEKSRKGPEAIVDMRGKHKPVNKTTEETLQNIRELVIYLTGMRPHRTNNNRLDPEYRDISRLYQVYKYDSEKKGKKFASLGIFRNVLVKEFCIKSVKPNKMENSNGLCEKSGILTTQKSPSSSSETWPINIPQPSPMKNKISSYNEMPCPMKSKVSSLNELLPKSVTCGDSHFADLDIPNL